MKTLVVLFFLFNSLTLSFALAENTKPEVSKFKIGVIVPLSGALSEYGLASKNGIELAVSSNPQVFSNIEFIYEDSQWDSKTAITAFTKLTKADKVNLVYNWGNPTTEALAPLAESSQTPLIALSLDQKIGIGKNFLIRSINRADDFSEKLANYLN
jgi:branched-chain amino acid transport system substrate-binding protein